MFNATQIETTAGTLTNTISVSSDTTWTCSVEGNFMLNTYEGKDGETLITLSAVNTEDHIGHGIVVFRYTENDCLKQFDCPFWYYERDWMKITPNVAYFSGDTNNEYVTFNVECADNDWEFELPSGFRGFKTNNKKLYIIKDNSENGVVNVYPHIYDDKYTAIVNFNGSGSS